LQKWISYKAHALRNELQKTCGNRKETIQPFSIYEAEMKKIETGFINILERFRIVKSLDYLTNGRGKQEIIEISLTIMET
jgi:hypothetical protein